MAEQFGAGFPLLVKHWPFQWDLKCLAVSSGKVPVSVSACPFSSPPLPSEQLPFACSSMDGLDAGLYTSQTCFSHQHHEPPLCGHFPASGSAVRVSIGAG